MINGNINTVKPYLTTTSVIWPPHYYSHFFGGAWQNGPTFSCKKPSLIWSPINMAKIFWPIADCINGAPL